MPNTIQTIHRDILIVKEKYGINWFRWLNNFHVNLPLGMKRSHPFVDMKISFKNRNERISQLTYREFHRDIDHSIASTGLDQRLIETLMRESPHKNMSRLYSYTLPAYVHLRQKGYKHYPDLSI